MGKEYNDYFLIDNYQYVAYVPIGMVDSLYTQRADNDGYDEKGRVNVVFVTRSGKEYIQPGFKNQTAAQDFCHKMMMHIESYNIDSLLAFGAQKKSSE